ncbi:MAG: DUF4085 family protein [Epulopiscium sp.]|nr:DUF4085 family protein [Candidatus Epulonipiscium sp.]
MRYLTKEWYGLCQMTGLHFGMRSHKGTYQKDEDLYLRLKKRKEKEFIKMERELYDFDPREMLEIYDGSVFISAEKFIAGEEIHDEDTIVYHMPEEEKDHINKLIEEYDSREPFDVDKCKIEFNKRQDIIQSENINNLATNLYSQIADPRVFALGYCTKEILSQLKRLSKENEIKVRRVLNEYTKVQKKEMISEQLRERFGFHDCQVMSCEFKQDIVFFLDTSGGFTENNKITFKEAKIIKQEKSIEESYWLYEELYYNQGGYEAHMLFAGEDIHELTISCKDIIIERV